MEHQILTRPSSPHSVVDVSRKEVKGAGEESSLAYQIPACDRLEDKRTTVHGSMDGASIECIDTLILALVPEASIEPPFARHPRNLFGAGSPPLFQSPAQPENFLGPCVRNMAVTCVDQRVPSVVCCVVC